MIEIKSFFLQLSISVIKSNCIRCNTLGIAPNLNPKNDFTVFNSQQKSHVLENLFRSTLLVAKDLFLSTLEKYLEKLK